MYSIGLAPSPRCSPFHTSKASGTRQSTNTTPLIHLICRGLSDRKAIIVRSTFLGETLIHSYRSRASGTLWIPLARDDRRGGESPFRSSSSDPCPCRAKRPDHHSR